MSKILDWLNNLCAAVALALAGYFYGKENAENEQLEAENKIVAWSAVPSIN